MHRTPLHQFHVDAGARMVDYAGWEMPLTYGSVLDEHRQVRTKTGLFDVSHMGRIGVKGRHARRFLERLCTRKIDDMQPGQCRYSLVCNAQGGVRDDVLVYRMEEDDFLMVVNAANREKILGHMAEVKGDLSAAIDDRTLSTAMVALQGPGAMELIGKFSREIPTLKRYRFAVKNLLVIKVIVSRTGYTGEDGVEAIFPAAAVGMALKMMLKDFDPKKVDGEVKPAGLAARDTLRLEAGMPLYGHELGEDMNALGAGVDFAISLDKDQGEGGEAFIGMEALKKAREEGGPSHRIAGLFVDGKRTARQGMRVLSGDREVGRITSACTSPTLERNIAMAWVEQEFAEGGRALRIDTGRDSVLDAMVTPLPFYKAPKMG